MNRKERKATELTRKLNKYANMRRNRAFQKLSPAGGPGRTIVGFGPSIIFHRTWLMQPSILSDFPNDVAPLLAKYLSVTDLLHLRHCSSGLRLAWYRLHLSIVLRLRPYCPAGARILFGRSKQEFVLKRRALKLVTIVLFLSLHSPSSRRSLC